MKNVFLLLAVAALLCAGCAKEGGILCDGVDCQNGGTCKKGVCDCPPGFTGTNCETDIRRECEKNNTGTVIFANSTSDDWNIYVNGAYVGWVDDYTTLTVHLGAGARNFRYEQTDYIFTQDILYGSATIQQCTVQTVYIN